MNSKSGSLHVVPHIPPPKMKTRLASLIVLAVLTTIGLRAEDIFVTNNGDSGTDSLRDAIAGASDGDVIRFNPSLAGQTVALSTEISITQGITVDGSDVPGGATISGEDTSRIFNISGSGKTVILQHLTITRGKAADGTVAQSGGAILHGSGILTITECTISNSSAGNALPTTNQRSGGSGGGIISDGTLNIHNTTISGNRAGKGNTMNSDMSVGSGGSGGGIHGNGAEILIENSTIHGNYAGDGGDLNGGAAGGAGGNGGGVSLQGPNGLTIRNSTITGNYAGNADPLNNSVPPGSGGGVFFNTSPSLSISNTIVAGNFLGTGGFAGATGPDINPDVSSVTPSGINIIGDNKTVKSAFPTPPVVGEPNANGDLVGSAQDPFDPELSPLQNNGGPTFTQIPLPGSSAINPMNASDTSSLNTDQRGESRVIGGALDVGAVEAPDYAAIAAAEAAAQASAAAARAAERARTLKKIRKLKLKAKSAKRKGQVARAKKFKKKLKKLTQLL